MLVLACVEKQEAQAVLKPDSAGPYCIEFVFVRDAEAWRNAELEIAIHAL